MTDMRRIEEARGEVWKKQGGDIIPIESVAGLNFWASNQHRYLLWTSMPVTSIHKYTQSNSSIAVSCQPPEEPVLC